MPITSKSQLWCRKRDDSSDLLTCAKILVLKWFLVILGGDLSDEEGGEAEDSEEVENDHEGGDGPS